MVIINKVSYINQLRRLGVFLLDKQNRKINDFGSFENIIKCQNKFTLRDGKP